MCIHINMVKKIYLVSVAHLLTLLVAFGGHQLYSSRQLQHTPPIAQQPVAPLPPVVDSGPYNISPIQIDHYYTYVEVTYRRASPAVCHGVWTEHRFGA